MKTKHDTRESWLNQAVHLFRETFQIVGAPLPEKIYVSVGLPAGGGSRTGAHSIGQCWNTRASDDGINHVFVSPEKSDPIDILNILCHELIHVSDDCKSGHRGHFSNIKKRLGLDGVNTATTPGRMLEMFQAMSDELGTFPHAALKVSKGKTAPTTVKMICVCGFNARVSYKWVREYDGEMPTCPCGCKMKYQES